MDPNSYSTLLLCAVLPTDRVKALPPLSPSEFHGLRTSLRDAKVELAELSDPRNIEQHISRLQGTKLSDERLVSLLKRGTEIDEALERWSQADLWVISYESEAYPVRLRDRLRDTAPPLLFGSGRVNLLSGGGLGVVGSRNADDEALEFTSKLAELAAEQGITIISGGARGVDQAAMLASLEAGGHAVGLLADSLAKESVSDKYRVHADRGHLVLATPFSPEAPFSVGNAMSRNKLIYALSDACLVISADADAGGTWSGAVENLKRKWCPLLVRENENAPRGNAMLIRRGGIPFDSGLLSRKPDLTTWFSQDKANDQPSLFDA